MRKPRRGRESQPNLTVMVGLSKPRRRGAHADPFEEDLDLDEDEDDLDEEDLPGGFGSDEEEDNARIVRDAADALRGRHRRPDEALNEFIEVFGRSELEHLRQLVTPEEPLPEGIMHAAGGRLISGPGRGMQDRIPAAAGDQPVLLSDGEFVVPADVVSHLGDGSTSGGVRALEAMMHRVRSAKTGSGKQAKPLKLAKVLPG